MALLSIKTFDSAICSRKRKNFPRIFLRTDEKSHVILDNGAHLRYNISITAWTRYTISEMAADAAEEYRK